MLTFSEWLHLPKTKQKRSYDCGAAAFRAVCKYYGIVKTQEEFIKLLGTNDESGTSTKAIIKLAKKLGFNVKAGNHFDIKKYLDQDIPVICAVQAWGSKKQYESRESGHYVVALGYKNNKVIFEDPSIKTNARGSLSFDEFDKRWYDEGANDKKFNHYGIAIWKDVKTDDQVIKKTKRIE